MSAGPAEAAAALRREEIAEDRAARAARRAERDRLANAPIVGGRPNKDEMVFVRQQVTEERT